jgi:hypothetical protein
VPCLHVAFRPSVSVSAAALTATISHPLPHLDHGVLPGIEVTSYITSLCTRSVCSHPGILWTSRWQGLVTHVYSWWLSKRTVRSRQCGCHTFCWLQSKLTSSTQMYTVCNRTLYKQVLYRGAVYKQALYRGRVYLWWLPACTAGKIRALCPQHFVFPDLNFFEWSLDGTHSFWRFHFELSCLSQTVT